MTWTKVAQKNDIAPGKSMEFQVNGKKRGSISVQNDVLEKDLINSIKDKKLINKDFMH